MLTIRNMKKTANSICNSKKRINYLGMSLIKVAKSRYSEKHKMLLKGTNKWKGARVPGTGGGHVDHPKAQSHRRPRGNPYQNLTATFFAERGKPP